MQLRWTEAAAADLERIADYLFEQIRNMPPASRLQFMSHLKSC
jgi:plasmid stabilization system protein ParE